MNTNFAVIVPMANEQLEFNLFIASLNEILDQMQCGKVYLIIDNVSIDDTLNLCKDLSRKDERYITVWAPENKNVVDAYMRGYKEALQNKHDYIIEMDAGLSHNPDSLPMFIKRLTEGYDCAFGSRLMEGGSIYGSTFKRRFLSKIGTLLSNLLLGTKLTDMTSGYQGFASDIVEKFVDYNLLSIAHFYQTELRYLLRNANYVEVPIHYRAPSPGITSSAITNSLKLLIHYTLMRFTFRSPQII